MFKQTQFGLASPLNPKTLKSIIFLLHHSPIAPPINLKMAKRPAEEIGGEADALKGGERPSKSENGEEMEFEDEFEDEYESEEDIFEAGVDGRPDEEREAEERRGTWYSPKALCDCPRLDAFQLS